MEPPDLPEPSFEPILEALALGGGLSSDDLAELEDHLFSSYEGVLEAGTTPSEAPGITLARFGSPDVLSFEFRKTQRMKPFSRLFGIALTLGMLLFAIAPFTSLGSFVDFPSALLVSGLVLGGLVASFGPAAIRCALFQAFEAAPSAERDVRTSLRLARHGYRLSWAAGAVGVLVGTVNLLANLSDPSQLGGGLALAVLSLLYGALLAELCFANLGQWLQRDRLVAHSHSMRTSSSSRP